MWGSWELPPGWLSKQEMEYISLSHGLGSLAETDVNSADPAAGGAAAAAMWSVPVERLEGWRPSPGAVKPEASGKKGSGHLQSVMV